MNRVAIPLVENAHADSGAGGNPRHVAIIMDGNGRWAKKRHLPRVAGHRQGVEAVRNTIRGARSLGIEVLTLYAFSSENWRRPEDEINDLKGLLRHFLGGEVNKLDEHGIRLRVIGDFKRFGPEITRLIEDSCARTAGNTSSTLVIALNYGGQAEIARAAQRAAEDVVAGRLVPSAIDAAAIASRLDTADLPPLDLLIRTSGEQRLSNFLLWQAAYAELVFVDTLWPDFDEAALARAVDGYRLRDRRFGGL